MTKPGEINDFCSLPSRSSSPSPVLRVLRAQPYSQRKSVTLQSTFSIRALDLSMGLRDVIHPSEGPTFFPTKKGRRRLGPWGRYLGQAP